VIAGGVISAVHVTVLDAVALLPHPSIAVNVLICVRSQPLLPIVPSEELTVGIPHASVAIAVPSALLISEATGLHPNVVVLPPVVNVGGIISAVQVTVDEAVAELPQPSEAINVLVCDREQLLVDIVPSVNVTAGVPHAADAVAVPRAALISEVVGLQPRVGVPPVIEIVGGFGALVQLTVLEVVALLPQPSTAVKVLTCATVQPEVVGVASDEVILVTAPQPSVAVADPSAPVISEACGLHPRITLV
jgi:hypothetical protein